MGNYIVNEDGTLVIPAGTTSVGGYSSDSTIKRVIFEEPVADNIVIEASAFYNCANLESIELPNTVTAIGARAFSYCTSLTAITIPANVSEWGIEFL